MESRLVWNQRIVCMVCQKPAYWYHSRMWPRLRISYSKTRWVYFHVAWFNTLRPIQNGRHFADDTFKPIFLNENIRISIKISLKFVSKGLIPALVLIMAWRRPGDKPLSEEMLVRSLTHICVTRPPWVKQIKDACCPAGHVWGCYPVAVSLHYGLVAPYNDMGLHYDDIIMSVMASQITSLTIVYSSVYSGADQRKHHSSASLVFVRRIHQDRWIPRTMGQLRRKCFHLMT